MDVEWLFSGVLGALKSVFQIAVIVIPLMVVLELAREYKVLDICARGLSPFSRAFRLPPQGSFPILVGLIFGISYGAGVIIQSAREGILRPKELLIIQVFLAICHAVVEDTLLFVAIGANALWLIGVRLSLAVVTTAVAARFLLPKVKEQGLPLAS